MSYLHYEPVRHSLCPHYDIDIVSLLHYESEHSFCVPHYIVTLRDSCCIHITMWINKTVSVSQLFCEPARLFLLHLSYSFHLTSECKLPCYFVLCVSPPKRVQKCALLYTMGWHEQRSLYTLPIYSQECKTLPVASVKQCSFFVYLSKILLQLVL